MNKKPIILIVDDQDDNRFAIKLALKKEEYEFLEAENGVQALEVAKQTKPDVILMDAIMPEMDGFDTTRELRNSVELERVPVLMITALNEKEDRIRALDAGVNDFITKPFDKHELIARCRSYVSMSQLNSKYVDATNNPISGLPNRGALQSDLKKISEPLVVVCSYDDYDNLAEFYSEEILHRMEEEFIKLFKEHFPLDENTYTFYHPNSGLFAIATDVIFNFELNKESVAGFLESFYETIRGNVIEFDVYEFTPVITLGVSIDSELPYENAKTALKEAHKQGKNFLFADDVLEKVQKETSSNVEWMKKVKAAVLEDRFVPYFQPLFNNETKKVEKYECLIRMIEDDGKVVSPFFFIEVSKKAKYYHQLTRIMLEKSMKAFENREDEFSVNLSGLDIENDILRNHIIDRVKENPEVAKRMVFELLEDESFENFDTIIDFITEVKKYGVKIAIDDFGSGYSNFTRLMDFQPDILKIDGSLIKDIHENKFSQNIVSTIQSFCDKIGYKTVAEFVSCEEIYDYIQTTGITYTQGYYISEPISMEELSKR